MLERLGLRKPKRQTRDLGIPFNGRPRNPAEDAEYARWWNSIGVEEQRKWTAYFQRERAEAVRMNTRQAVLAAAILLAFLIIAMLITYFGQGPEAVVEMFR